MTRLLGRCFTCGGDGRGEGECADCQEGREAYMAFLPWQRDYYALQHRNDDSPLGRYLRALAHLNERDWIAS